jgi:hypothetical protein
MFSQKLKVLNKIADIKLGANISTVLDSNESIYKFLAKEYGIVVEKGEKLESEEMAVFNTNDKNEMV